MYHLVWDRAWLPDTQKRPARAPELRAPNERNSLSPVVVLAFEYEPSHMPVDVEPPEPVHTIMPPASVRRSG